MTHFSVQYGWKQKQPLSHPGREARVATQFARENQTQATLIAL